MTLQFSKVVDNLYLCGAHSINAQRMRDMRVTCVINCTMEVSNMPMPHVEYLKLGIDDMPNVRISLHFDRCADKINEVLRSGGTVLVHCVAGVSRSATIVLAYLMKHRRMPLREAYFHLKSCRPIIRPNPGFFQQLVDYEKRLFGKATVAMVPSPMGRMPSVYTDEVLSAGGGSAASHSKGGIAWMTGLASAYKF